MAITLPWVPGPDAGAGEVEIMASRFELKSRWTGVMFLLYSMVILNQIRRTPGNVGVSLKAQPLQGVYWTLSAWTDKKSLYGVVKTDPHGRIMAKVKPWMKAAKFDFWPATAKPTWADADKHVG